MHLNHLTKVRHETGNISTIRPAKKIMANTGSHSQPSGKWLENKKYSDFVQKTWIYKKYKDASPLRPDFKIKTKIIIIFKQFR